MQFAAYFLHNANLLLIFIIMLADRSDSNLMFIRLTIKVDTLLRF